MAKIFIGRLGEIPADGMRRMQAAGLSAPVLVLRAGADVRAWIDRCPHAASPLSEGVFDGARLQCGRHGWQFDARSGQGCDGIAGRFGLTAVKLEIGELGELWVEI